MQVNIPDLAIVLEETIIEIVNQKYDVASQKANTFLDFNRK